MSGEPRLVETTGGRVLGFATWGDPSGLPVLAFHGTPGSRLSRPPDEEALRRAGLCLITYDRPGYGVSDRSAGRRVVDCVVDAEAVLDTLDVERVAVTGTSGGGPHALAMAARLPDRVVAAQTVVGLAPFDAEGLDWLAGVDPENVAEVGWARAGEQVLYRELSRVAAEDLARIKADPAKVFSDEWQLPDSDRQVLAREDVQQVFAESLREAFRVDVWGWVDDDLAFLRPWGFGLDEITVPTTLRYGEDDVMVPAAHGAWLAEHIPHGRSIVEKTGHMADPETIVQRLSDLARGN